MFKLKTIIIGLYLAIGAATIGYVTHNPTPVEPINVVAYEVEKKVEIVEEPIAIASVVEEEPIVIEEVQIIEEPEPEVIEELPISEEEIELIALITMAEAEGESEEGKRLVIDTILNRMDHDRFPDTATDVIYQKSQFSCVWNGRVDRCYVTEENVELVKEELANRTNYDVMFFTAGKYGNYGTPMFVEGNHYFSSYT